MTLTQLVIKYNQYAYQDDILVTCQENSRKNWNKSAQRSFLVEFPVLINLSVVFHQVKLSMYRIYECIIKLLCCPSS